MTKTAFLFAGQGAQKLGMASDLYEKYPIVRRPLIKLVLFLAIIFVI